MPGNVALSTAIEAAIEPSQNSFDVVLDSKVRVTSEELLESPPHDK